MKNKLLLIGLAALLLQACASKPEPVIPEQFILLPQEDGSASAIVIESKDPSRHSLVLDQPYTVAKLGGQRIETERTDAAGVAQRYRAVMEALPARPRSYTLYFEFGKTQLTKESLRLLEQILLEMRQLSAPELIVIGHTDDVGSDTLNDELSLRRANAVLSLLKSKGMSLRETSVVGRGKREPLVIGKKGVPEPKNRRVEIRIK